MKFKGMFSDFVVSFFIITACVTILEGVLCSIFYPDIRFGPDAFLIPPMFGFVTALSSFMTTTKKEPTVRQIIVSRIVQLLIVEGIVFGITYAAGNRYSPLEGIVLALSIAVVYALVYLVLWLSEYRSSRLFNAKLKEYQSAVNGRKK